MNFTGQDEKSQEQFAIKTDLKTLLGFPEEICINSASVLKNKVIFKLFLSVK